MFIARCIDASAPQGAHSAPQGAATSISSLMGVGAAAPQGALCATRHSRFDEHHKVRRCGSTTRCTLRTTRCRRFDEHRELLIATAATVTSKLQHQAHCHPPVYLWGRSISGSPIFRSAAAGRWAHMGGYADKLARHHRPQSSKCSCMHVHTQCEHSSFSIFEAGSLT